MGYRQICNTLLIVPSFLFPFCYIFHGWGHQCGGLWCRRPDPGNAASHLHISVPAQRLQEQPKHLPSYILIFLPLCTSVQQGVTCCHQPSSFVGTVSLFRLSHS